jgi:uncharacterized protein
MEGGTMSAQENLKLVRQGYEHFKSGNIQGLLSLFSDDIQWELPQIENVPFAGKRRGREQVGQFFVSLGKEQEVVQFDPQEFVADDEQVVVLGHYAWRVKSTGQKYEGDWAHVFTVRGGRIVRFREYTDTATAAAAYRKS